MASTARPLLRRSRALGRPVAALVAVASVALLFGAPLDRAAAATAPTTTLNLAAGAPATFTAVAPAKKVKRVLTLGASAPTASGDAVVALRGALRVRSGRRSATFTGLRLEFGLVSASVTATSGGKRLTLLAVKARKGKPLRVDARTGAVRVDQASVTLAPAGAKALKTALRLRSTPSAKRAVGTLTLIIVGRAVAPAAPKLPVAAPVVASPAPAAPASTTPRSDTPPSADPDPDPDPGPPCWGVPPAGFTDWITCDETGGADFGFGNLRSWINYILSPNWGPGASIATTDGADRVDATSPYDYRLPVGTTKVNGDGTVTIAHAGRIAYTLPAHGVDNYVEDLTFTVAADRSSATVTLTAQYKDRNAPVDDPPVVGTLAAMTVDLTAAASTSTSGGLTTYVHAPAKLTADGQEIWGTSYDIGAPWGAFTITVPA